MSFLARLDTSTKVLVSILAIVGIAAAAAVTLVDYKRTLDGLDDRLKDFDRRLMQAEKGFTSTGQRAPGPAGPPGPQGERGLQGGKGDPGVTPNQLADFEKRLAFLEARGVNPGAQASTNSQVAPARSDPATPSKLPAARNGCHLITPDLVIARGEFVLHDKICAGDLSKISAIADIRENSITLSDRVVCYVNSQPCYFHWSRDVEFSVVKIIPGPDAQTRRVEIEFRKR